MITYQEYAKKWEISYEAVRKSVARYKKELEGHIIKQHRKSYLDDYAVTFLDEHREIKTVTVVDGSSVKEIERLKEEIKAKELAWANERAELRNQIADLKEEKTQLLLESKTKEDAAAAEVERLKNRGLIARILNK